MPKKKKNFMSHISFSFPFDIQLEIAKGYVQRWASQLVLEVKNSPANAGDIRDADSIPELGRTLGGRHGNPLQYSCLEDSMDRGVWRATVHGVSKNLAQLKRHTQTYTSPSLLQHCLQQPRYGSNLCVHQWVKDRWYIYTYMYINPLQIHHLQTSYQIFCLPFPDDQ